MTATRQQTVAEAEPASGLPASDPRACDPRAPGLPGDERETALTALFERHYTGMLRLAVLLGADDAEDIVAEAFCELHRRWDRLRTADAALPYLRSVVCNLTRMRLRHLQVVRKHTDLSANLERSAESVALLRDDQKALVQALRQLSGRQREALVLRYWLGLGESDIAAAMGISCGSVKAHTSRGMAALNKIMQERR
ncbi:RNA polymerase sigma-70 factor, sigma-E family [Sinosporangium album]|uniref:RNA polymerase sigma-70 factor, sigma-E family n=1 Tax=Sinosporangium album TaxID=504805 RepID=A0A1G8HZC4_9ACTN|nr:SigE family RNA polymerase sigma factor [Sinosporangium album]SDI11983.1 RNA polymerase sigma-70 factor, sigma-E family [Sinosporangium album]